MTDDSTTIVTAALIHRENRMLLAERPPGSWMEGYWEFPGGKVEMDEDLRDCLKRELLEEIGVRSKVGALQEAVIHHYPDRKVLLLFYWCDIAYAEPVPMEGQRLCWVSRDEMNEVKILPADRPVIEHLQKCEWK